MTVTELFNALQSALEDLKGKKAEMDIQQAAFAVAQESYTAAADDANALRSELMGALGEMLPSTNPRVTVR